jgi:hypothetical protein
MLTYVILWYFLISCVILCYLMLSHVILCYLVLTCVILCYFLVCYLMVCYLMFSYVMLSCVILLFYVILCSLMLSYVISCYLMLSHVTLWYPMLSRAIVCYLMLSHVIIRSLILFVVVSCYLMLPYEIFCYLMLSYVISCYIILCYLMLSCVLKWSWCLCVCRKFWHGKEMLLSVGHWSVLQFGDLQLSTLHTATFPWSIFGALSTLFFSVTIPILQPPHMLVFSPFVTFDHSTGADKSMNGNNHNYHGRSEYHALEMWPSRNWRFGGVHIHMRSQAYKKTVLIFESPT